MSNQLILALGWLLGQAMYGFIKAYTLQKTNENLTAKEALSVVFAKSALPYGIAFLTLLIGLFLMPEFFKNVLDADDKGHSPAWAQTVVTWFRASSIVFGFAAQYGALFLFGNIEKKTKGFIDSKLPADEV